MEGIQILAASHVLPRLGEREDIGKARGSRSDTKEYKIGRNSFGCAAGDDSIVLREVGNEHPDEDESNRCPSG